MISSWHPGLYIFSHDYRVVDYFQRSQLEKVWFCLVVIFSIFLQIAVKRREAKSKGEKERYKHLNAEFKRIARRDKSSSVIRAKK